MLFQADGPAMAKAHGRTRRVGDVVWYTCSRFRSAERRRLWLDSGTQWSARYWAVRPFWHWCTTGQFLKPLQSQCNAL